MNRKIYIFAIAFRLGLRGEQVSTVIIYSGHDGHDGHDGPDGQATRARVS